LGRRWAFVLAQAALSALAWGYALVFAASMFLMVLVVGLLTARTVLPLARVLANGSLRAATWARGREESSRIPARPAGSGLTAVVSALVRSPATWRSVLYLAFNAVLLPVHVFVLAVFPLAWLWGSVDAWLTVRLLASVGVSGSDSAPPVPVTAPHPAPGGFGLAGMAERVAALGGRFEAGAVPDGGFEVRAVLPLPGEDGRGSR
jgi:hypothetical protein